MPPRVIQGDGMAEAQPARSTTPTTGRPDTLQSLFTDTMVLAIEEENLSGLGFPPFCPTYESITAKQLRQVYRLQSAQALPEGLVMALARSAPTQEEAGNGSFDVGDVGEARFITATGVEIKWPNGTVTKTSWPYPSAYLGKPHKKMQFRDLEG
mmetsp:Transcript_60239/g.161640  ORF Transcript_60239/g.161640 Transcript_60239/m.161640 type:complete len:154 (-) Transcript_60239:46-507(-)